MKLSISTFVTIFILSISVILSGSFIAMQLQITNTREYNAAVIDRIQASNFSPEIIGEVTTKSIEDGYPTTVKEVTLYEDKPEVLVTTKYEVGFPFFGIVKEGVVEGYAR